MDSFHAPTCLISASSQRSGSTWLQRILHAATDVFMWGESFPLVEMLSYIYADFKYHDAVRSQERVEFLARAQSPATWIANANPSLQELKQGIRALFAQFYADTHGRTGYGWKEVHYGRNEIEFLRELFPDLRLILLVRNPLQVVQSLKRLDWLEAQGLADVCARWNQRTRDYVALATQPNTLLLRYEDIRERLPSILTFAGGQMNERVRLAMDAETGKSKATSELTDAETQVVCDLCADTMRDLGYALPVGWTPSSIVSPMQDEPQVIVEKNLHMVKGRRAIQFLQAQIQSLRQELDDQRTQTASLVAQIGERQQAVDSLAAQLAAQTAKVNDLVALVAERQRAVEILIAQLEQK